MYGAVAADTVSGMVGVGYPLVMPLGHVQGVHHPTLPLTVSAATAPGTAHRAGTGLWAQSCSQGPGGGSAGRLAAGTLLYLRLFSPGQPIRP